MNMNKKSLLKLIFYFFNEIVSKNHNKLRKSKAFGKEFSIEQKKVKIKLIVN
jgi:hypothetical protein